MCSQNGESVNAEVRSCLNPECDRDVDTIGVCLVCVHSDYNAKRDGAQAGELVTDGITRKMGQMRRRV